MLAESSSRGHKQFILKTPIKSFESHRFFWDGRPTANNQYFNLGLNKISMQLLNMYNVLFSMPSLLSCHYIADMVSYFAI
jgi:hypothetical protein